ncbi:MAG: hypothetical protein HQM04_18385 [Magnetococcales bacterium]|nr:hypothetical protein [Magnetococcales bacterium]MBF0116997.1 hypothetical protein [Magnetococcales bacterium]
MTAKADIKRIAEGIDSQFGDEVTAFFDRETGDVLLITGEDRNAVEQGDPLDSYPEWQHEMIETAKMITNDTDGRYLALPSQRDFNEYEVMEQFCASLDNEEQAEELLYALRGRGAFRRFKDKVQQLDIREEWFRFRDRELLVFATEWIIDNGLVLADQVDK